MQMQPNTALFCYEIGSPEFKTAVAAPVLTSAMHEIVEDLRKLVKHQQQVTSLFDVRGISTTTHDHALVMETADLIRSGIISHLAERGIVLDDL